MLIIKILKYLRNNLNIKLIKKNYKYNLFNGDGWDSTWALEATSVLKK